MRVVAGLFLCIAFTSSLNAQSVDSLMRAARAGNWYVRLTTPDQRVTEGRIFALADDSVRVGRSSVPLHGITIIDRRTRLSGGAIPGGVFGAVGLGVFGSLVSSALCEGDCRNAGLEGAVGGAAFGFAVGASLGGVVRPGKAVWHRLYPHADSMALPERRLEPKVTDAPSLAGGALTISVGPGFAAEKDDIAMGMRSGLQFSHTVTSGRPIELAVAGESLLFASAGTVLLASAGPNFVRHDGAYLGPTVGYSNAGDGAIVLGIRSGQRTWRPLGLRPEARADIFFTQGHPLVLFSGTVGLETH